MSSESFIHKYTKINEYLSTLSEKLAEDGDQYRDIDGFSSLLRYMSGHITHLVNTIQKTDIENYESLFNAKLQFDEESSNQYYHIGMLQISPNIYLDKSERKFSISNWHSKYTTNDDAVRLFSPYALNFVAQFDSELNLEIYIHIFDKTKLFNEMHIPETKSFRFKPNIRFYDNNSEIYDNIAMRHYGFYDHNTLDNITNSVTILINFMINICVNYDTMHDIYFNFHDKLSLTDETDETSQES